MSRTAEQSDAVVSPDQRLNLGCGEDYREGWHNVDISPAVEPDEIVNLDETPWPLPDNHFSAVNAEHVLEHLDDPVGALEEIIRVSTPGATVRIVYPIGHTIQQDPQHKHFWTWKTANHLAGTSVHSHETDLKLEKKTQKLSWWLDPPSLMLKVWTVLRLRRHGPGNWVNQVPGLAGETTVWFEVTE